MMHLNSLAIKTDLIFARFSGEVIDRGNYLVIRTPSNTGYHLGNYLAFADPPTSGDEKAWPTLFKDEFSDLAEVNHMAFTWDVPMPGDATTDFVNLGFTFESNKVLAATSVHTPAMCNCDVIIKQIESDQQWESVIQEQMTANKKYEPRAYEKFKRAQMANYRKMTEAGTGCWLGAYLNGRLVADLGVCHNGGFARFQSVVTLPSFQRMGICGRLVYESAKYALDAFGVETSVMVADESYHAAKIYESVGFQPTQSNYTLAYWKE